MKTIVLLLLVFGLASAKKEDIMELIIRGLKGFFDGFNENKELNITKCVKDGVEAVVKLKEIIEYWKKIDWKDIETIIKFLIDVSTLGEYFFGAFEPCIKMFDEFKIIGNNIKNLTKEKFWQRATDNIFLLLNWLNDAIRSIVNKDLYNLCKNFGKLANLFIYGRDPLN